MRVNNTAPAAVTLHNVTAVLGGNRILDGVSLSVPAQGNTVIIGPNGAGKSTLLLTMLGKIRYTGSILFAGGAMPRIGYVPQKLNFDSGIPVTVMEFACLGRRRLPYWFGVGKRNKEHALDLLDSVGAAELRQRRLGALSGGELRRVLLALALDRRPELLVLDEPTSGVDFKGEGVFHDLLDRLREEQGFTQLMVCHNLALVRRYATWVVCLNRTIAAEGRPEAMLCPGILTRTFVGMNEEGWEAVRAHEYSPAIPEVFHA